MCGFIVYKDHGDNTFICKRGQDLTNKIEFSGFTFIHNLLSVTGKFTPQPFVKGKTICVFNGEIYNHEYKDSDGENLIPLYEKYGVSFPSHLDGEWSIALYDFDKKLAIFSTDIFATKPLWRKGLECASYESGIGGHKIAANTIEVVYFNGEEEKQTIYNWDFDQHKNTYKDWIQAFRKSVKKRATSNCFIGLSSGYDSGAIACELTKLDVNFKSYIVEAKEDRNILTERMAKLSNYEYIDSSESYLDEKTWLNQNVENFNYKIKSKRGIHDDSAALALSKIFRKANSEGRKVYLSGQGADEILSDYSTYPNQSTFKGKFPDRLTIWNNFYDGCQYSYLGKEEYVAGSHSIEARYPYLDRELVQEFLWLSPALKNKNYKAPLHEYLVKEKYPFSQGVKIGLSHIK